MFCLPRITPGIAKLSPSESNNGESKTPMMKISKDGRKKFDSFAIEFVKSDFDHPATTREESKV